MNSAFLTVGEVSELTRMSVRTLHHYDEIGLLVPSERTEAGYRLYTPGDLERLRRVLTFRPSHIMKERVDAGNKS